MNLLTLAIMSATDDQINAAARNLYAVINHVVKSGSFLCNSFDIFSMFGVYYPEDMQKVLDMAVILIQGEECDEKFIEPIFFNVSNMQNFISSLAEKKYKMSAEYLDNKAEQSIRDAATVKQINEDAELALKLSAE